MMPSVAEVTKAIDQAAEPENMSPQDALNFYEDVAEHCTSAAEALREEMADEEDDVEDGD